MGTNRFSCSRPAPIRREPYQPRLRFASTAASTAEERLPRIIRSPPYMIKVTLIILNEQESGIRLNRFKKYFKKLQGEVHIIGEITGIPKK
jgi:hypothetical protein